jgi:hypothetical protein
MRAKEAAAFRDRPDKRHGGLPQLFRRRVHLPFGHRQSIER